jgi:hypothetical protein
MARKDVAPLALICSMTGMTLAAKRSAFALLEATPRRCACLSFANQSSRLFEALKDAGDELRMPRAASWRRYPALRQLGGDASQRQALLLQIAEDGR